MKFVSVVAKDMITIIYVSFLAYIIIIKIIKHINIVIFLIQEHFINALYLRDITINFKCLSNKHNLDNIASSCGNECLLNIIYH